MIVQLIQWKRDTMGKAKVFMCTCQFANQFVSGVSMHAHVYIVHCIIQYEVIRYVATLQADPWYRHTPGHSSCFLVSMCTP